MALSFGTNNQRINEALKTRFLGTQNSGATTYNHFTFADINNANYVTTFAIMGGTRPTLSISSNPATSVIPSQDSNCLVFWEYDGDWANWPTYVTDSADNVAFHPNFFPSKLATRSGTATWFLLQTRYSNTVYGVVTGTIGPIGSGADLEITDNSIVTDGQTEYTVPYGFQLYRPPVLV